MTQLTVKVDHRDIRVVGIMQVQKHLGQYKDRENLIEVGATQTPPDQADTLIHELMHCIWATRSFPKEMKEEEAVTRLASAWSTIMRDNPELVWALMQALRSGKPIFEEESKP